MYIKRVSAAFDLFSEHIRSPKQHVGLTKTQAIAAIVELLADVQEDAKNKHFRDGWQVGHNFAWKDIRRFLFARGGSFDESSKEICVSIPSKNLDAKEMYVMPDEGTL